MNALTLRHVSARIVERASIAVALQSRTICALSCCHPLLEFNLLKKETTALYRRLRAHVRGLPFDAKATQLAERLGKRLGG